MTPNPRWPVALDGIIESIVTTQGPDGAWNCAALGLRIPTEHTPTQPVRARTWGKTRTRKNFERNGYGYIQFLSDPLVFVEAALNIYESPDPILDESWAWVEVDVTRHASANAERPYCSWQLSPRESNIENQTVPVINRGFNAIIEMTVLASRLDVPTYDNDEIYQELNKLADIVRTCGGSREQRALSRIDTASTWDIELCES